MVITTIIDLIKSIASLNVPCGDDDNPDSDLCGMDACAQFLRDSDKMTATDGKIFYCNEVISSTPPSFDQVRYESVFLTGDSLTADYTFNNIISSINCTRPVGPFFPFGVSLSSLTPIDQLPYVADLTMPNINPDDGL